MNVVTSREVVHHFSAIAARVAAGQELTVTRHGQPVLKLMPLTPAEPRTQEREALVAKILSIRMASSIGKNFERSDAYND